MKTNEHSPGCVALLTGAGGGIGRVLARRLHQLGYTLALVGRNEEKLKTAAREASCVQSALLLAGDLCDKDFLCGVVPRVLGAFGRLDLLVNNAGICFVKNMEYTEYEELDALLKTNVYAPYMLSRDAISPLRASPCASIINIGSVVSHCGYPTQSAYATAKHALLGMTKALAAEVYRDDIRVHILCPGAVNTDMARTISRPDIDMDALIAPEDLADVMEFLLTHRSNSVIDEVRMHRVGKQPF